MNRWPNYCPKEVSCTCCEGLGDSHAGLLKLRCAFDPPFALQLIFSFSQQWRHVCNLFLFQDLYLQLRTALNWVDVRGLRIFLWVCWAVKPGGFHRKLQSGSAFLRQFFFLTWETFICWKPNVWNGVGVGELRGSSWFCDMGTHTSGCWSVCRTDSMLPAA